MHGMDAAYFYPSGRLKRIVWRCLLTMFTT